MNKGIKTAWICWILSLVIFAAVAIMVDVPRNACFWVAVFGMVMGFVLTAVTLRSCALHPEGGTGVMGMPLERAVVGVLLLQLFIGVVLVALCKVCPWLVAALVECLSLTVDAAALSRKAPGTEQAQEEPTDGEPQ